jgi:hypothetical protein
MVLVSTRKISRTGIAQDLSGLADGDNIETHCYIREIVLESTVDSYFHRFRTVQEIQSQNILLLKSYLATPQMLTDGTLEFVGADTATRQSNPEEARFYHDNYLKQQGEPVTA